MQVPEADVLQPIKKRKLLKKRLVSESEESGGEDAQADKHSGTRIQDPDSEESPVLGDVSDPIVAEGTCKHTLLPYYL